MKHFFQHLKYRIHIIIYSKTNVQQHSKFPVSVAKLVLIHSLQCLVTISFLSIFVTSPYLKRENVYPQLLGIEYGFHIVHEK